jgi:hypothetical protein
MKRITLVATAVLAVTGAGVALTDDGDRRIKESLNGFKEAAAVVSTTGTGTFRATISRDGDAIEYRLTFRDLEGDITQSHIHIGHPQNAGGIVLWLCQTAASPAPPQTDSNPPPCFAPGGDPRNNAVEGTLTAADVRAQTANGIAANEFAEVVRLIRAGRTYANIHTAKFPPGEIRSQIDGSDEGDHDHDHDHHD